jgi:hypothetical protein
MDVFVKEWVRMRVRAFNGGEELGLPRINPRHRELMYLIDPNTRTLNIK